MDDMTRTLQVLGMQQTASVITSRLFPSRESQLTQRSLELDIAHKKRLLGLPDDGEELDNGSRLTSFAPHLGAALLMRSRPVSGPRLPSLGMLSRKSLERGIQNGTRAVVRRIFG